MNSPARYKGKESLLNSDPTLSASDSLLRLSSSLLDEMDAAILKATSSTEELTEERGDDRVHSAAEMLSALRALHAWLRIRGPEGTALAGTIGPTYISPSNSNQSSSISTYQTHQSGSGIAAIEFTLSSPTRSITLPRGSCLLWRCHAIPDPSQSNNCAGASKSTCNQIPLPSRMIEGKAMKWSLPITFATESHIYPFLGIDIHMILPFPSAESIWNADQFPPPLCIPLLQNIQLDVLDVIAPVSTNETDFVESTQLQVHSTLNQRVAYMLTNFNEKGSTDRGNPFLSSVVKPPCTVVLEFWCPKPPLSMYCLLPDLLNSPYHPEHVISSLFTCDSNAPSTTVARFRCPLSNHPVTMSVVSTVPKQSEDFLELCISCSCPQTCICIALATAHKLESEFGINFDLPPFPQPLYPTVKLPDEWRRIYQNIAPKHPIRENHLWMNK